MLRLGQRTLWGKVAAIGTRDGERYYMMVNHKSGVALIPGIVAEELARRKQ